MKTDQSEPAQPARRPMLRRVAALGLPMALAAALLAGQSSARPAGPASVTAGPADVGIAVTASPDPVAVGQSLTYAVTVTNDGPERASSVNFRLLVSGRKTALVSAKPTQGVCDLAGNRVVCRLDRIEPKAQAQATIVVNPGLGPTVTASASVTTSSPDPNTSNQQVLVTTKVTETNPPTDVHITGADMTRPFQNGLQLTVAWTGKDAESGVATFDVRYRRASLGHGFGPYTQWRSQVKSRSAAFLAAAGSTYCFSVRATDLAGNTSAWSADRCTAIPIGVSSFVRRGAWLLQRGGGYFGSRYAYSRSRGATLTVPHVVGRSLALVATRCPACGSVTVLWNGKAVRTISLDYPFVAKRQIFPIARFGRVRSGSVQILLKSLKKRVKIEGLGISRV